MENVSTILDKIYSYEYFAPIIFGITAFLIVLFFVILFFGKKDEKSKELEKTKQLELASINAFNDVEQPKEIEITEPEIKENPFDKANEIASVEEDFIKKYNFPELDLGPSIEPPKEDATKPIDYPNVDLSEDTKTYVDTNKIDNGELKPILEPVKTDDIIINKDEAIEVKEVKDKFSSLAASIDDELNSLENMIKESHIEIEKPVEQNFEQTFEAPKIDFKMEEEKEAEKSFTQKYNFPKLDEEEKPMISKNIPGSKQIFSSVFVAPSKEEIPSEYNNDDFKEKFNSLLKNVSKPVEKTEQETKEKTKEEEQNFTQKYNFPKLDEEEKPKNSTIKPINFTIKERTDNKSVDLPKKAAAELPKLNNDESSEKITKEDFPEFPSLTNELESFKR